MNFRTLKIVMIILLCGAALCLCALLGLALAGRAGGFGSGAGAGEGEDYEVVQEWEFPVEEIRHMEVSMTSQTVYFYQGTDETVRIREFANFEPTDTQRTRVEETDGRLRIKGGKFHFFLFSFFSAWNRDTYLKIYLPQGFSRTLEDLQVETVSGDVFAENPFQGLGDFRFSSTSGDLFLKRLEGNGEISSVSGDLTMEEVDGRIFISTTSGDISVERALGEIEIDTVSGDAFLDQMEGIVKASSTSGDFQSGGLRGDFTFSTTSGDASLKLPQDGSYALDFETTSGDCSTFFDDVLRFEKDGRRVTGQYGGGEWEIVFSSTSGDLYIERAAR